MNKVIIIWLILITAYLGYAGVYDHKNLKLRNEKRIFLLQKNEETEARLDSIEQYLKGPLRKELDQVAKYLHQH